MGQFYHEKSSQEELMIGVESHNNAKLFYNLEKKVRKSHPLRKLKEILNLDFMYGLLKDKYGYNGNVSVPTLIHNCMTASLLPELIHIISVSQGGKNGNGSIHA